MHCARSEPRFHACAPKNSTEIIDIKTRITTVISNSVMPAGRDRAAGQRGHGIDAGMVTAGLRMTLVGKIMKP
ncbi:MAG: hypothetical protein MUC40_08810 [Akkermansiaceae bacterium]|nr:hypothetical protein [Akkermansiaceae bacterium]